MFWHDPPFNATGHLLHILDETEDFIVINKPPFLLMHPSKPNGPLTLWDNLCELLAYEILGGGQVSLINRLDRETSGIVLVAKNTATARSCCMSMTEGKIAKKYIALVHGWPKRETWKVQEPILRLGEVKKSPIWLQRGIHPEGAPSHTSFEVIEKIYHCRYGALSLLHCTPYTGRTHQIRVHLAHSGYPIVGDKIYGHSNEYYLEFIQTGWTRSLQERLIHPRHALHSCLLSIQFNDITYRWESCLPEDLQGLVNECFVM